MVDWVASEKNLFHNDHAFFSLELSSIPIIGIWLEV